MHSEVLYREEQRFTQPWLWALLGAMTAIQVRFFGPDLWRQLVGDRPASEHGLFVCLTAVGVPILAALFLGTTRLVTEVRGDGVHIWFRFMARRFVAFGSIKSVAARTYRPILECGGWGVRWIRKGRVYNVSGNRGVELWLDNGKRVLIGSQQAERLATAIEQGMSRGQSRGATTAS